MAPGECNPPTACSFALSTRDRWGWCLTYRCRTAHSVPPTLPPSVEEAYRRKCIQLKQRSHEVEEANDAARLRLARIKRQIEKLRLERAFLLEQLTKRTSTNVEDSEGSPSPPPTVCSSPPSPITATRRLRNLKRPGKLTCPAA